jgi:hypothetical protein
MIGLDPQASIAENYRRFGGREALHNSPAYVELAYATAEDEQILAFLASLPAPKQQPNLLFGAARFVLGRYATIEDLRMLVSDDDADLAAVMLKHRTQTNEPARCASLLPVFSQIPGPLALIEVGASAGLCLNIDRYGYDYGNVQIPGEDAAPTFTCELRGQAPEHIARPDVIWRAGLDLNPLDPARPEDREWLQCLVWPGQDQRLAQLRQALSLAQSHPVQVHLGDLLTDLPALVAQAPAAATVVVFHSAVLAYVDDAGRQRFRQTVTDLGVRWIANEAPGVVPGVEVEEDGTDGSVISLDGTAVARMHAHGRWVRWLA